LPSSNAATVTVALGSMTIFMISYTRRRAARMASSDIVTMSRACAAMIG
jgi:hypothetical protein